MNNGSTRDEGRESTPDNELNNNPKAQNVEELRTQLNRLTWSSSVLSNKDKKLVVEWLERDPASRNPKELSVRIDSFPDNERAVERQLSEFSQQMLEEIGFGHFAKKSRDPYLKWFKEELSYGERAEFLRKKNSDLHDTHRKELVDVFEGKREMQGHRLPEAIREEHRKEFMDGDMQEREKLLEKLINAHIKLKEKFLRFPDEVQKKFQAQFKAGGLKKRETVLQVMSKKGAAILPEKVEEEVSGAELLEAFQDKTATMVTQNLLSRSSKTAYDLWYKGLNINLKQKYADNSELDTRMKDREEARDAFFSEEFSAEVRAKHMERFMTADVDGKNALLAELRVKTKQTEQSYPDQVIAKTIQLALDDPQLEEQRTIYTLVDESSQMRRRGELRHEAKDTEDIVAEAAEEDIEIDEHVDVDMERLAFHKEDRRNLGLYLRAQRAKAGSDTVDVNNMDLIDDDGEDHTALSFRNHVVDPLKAELIARVTELAAARLPRSNRKQLEQATSKVDLKMDLHRIAS